jgi:hypothetical protein
VLQGANADEEGKIDREAFHNAMTQVITQIDDEESY